MARPRTTVSFVDLISNINGRLAAPSMPEEAQKELKALAVNLLIDAGQYRGFAYVYPGGALIPHTEVQRGHYEDHRVRFHTPASSKDRVASA